MKMKKTFVKMKHKKYTMIMEGLENIKWSQDLLNPQNSSSKITLKSSHKLTLKRLLKWIDKWKK